MIKTFPIGSKHWAGMECSGILADTRRKLHELAHEMWRSGNRATFIVVELPRHRCLENETVDQAAGHSFTDPSRFSEITTRTGFGCRRLA